MIKRSKTSIDSSEREKGRAKQRKRERDSEREGKREREKERERDIVRERERESKSNLPLSPFRQSYLDSAIVCPLQPVLWPLIHGASHTSITRKISPIVLR